MNYGVNIPLATKGFLSAQDIIELHRDMLNEKKFVYFSTSDRINPDKGKELSYLLLSNQFGIRVLCKIVSYDYFPTKGIPSDSAEYSPSKLANVPEKHWFKISTMDEANANDTSQLVPLNKQTEKKYSNVENYILNTGRLQIFYFQKTED